jgi:predicted transposase YbfD/YdcC
MLIDIIVLSIIAVLCGAESWNSIELFGKSKQDFLSKILRQRWGVENSQHWTLNVTFRENAQRKRNGHAASNFALVEKIALNLLKTEDYRNLSNKSKRLVAAWDNELLLKILRMQTS